MHRLKPASIVIIAISAATISLLSVVGLGKLGDGLFQAGAQGFGSIQGAAPGNGLLQDAGPLLGTGLFEGSMPLYGPLLGPRPPLDGGPTGVGGPIAGVSGLPAAPLHLASLPPNALLTGPRSTTLYLALWPPSQPSDPAPSDPRPAQPTTVCVTCFISPPAPAPI